MQSINDSQPADLDAVAGSQSATDRGADSRQTNDTPNYGAIFDRVVEKAKRLGYDPSMAEDVAIILTDRYARRGKRKVSSKWLPNEIRKEACRLQGRLPLVSTSDVPEDLLVHIPQENLSPGLSELLIAGVSACPAGPRQELMRLMGGGYQRSKVSRQVQSADAMIGRARAIAFLPWTASKAHRVPELADHYFEPSLCGRVHSSEVLEQFEVIRSTMSDSAKQEWIDALHKLIPIVRTQAFEALEGRAPGVGGVTTLYSLFYQGVRIEPTAFSTLFRDTRREARKRGLDRNSHVARHVATIDSYLGNDSAQIMRLRSENGQLNELAEGLPFVRGGVRSGFRIERLIRGEPEVILNDVRSREDDPGAILRYVTKRLPNQFYQTPGMSLMLLTWADQALKLTRSCGWLPSADANRRLVEQLDRAADRLRGRVTRAALASVRRRLSEFSR